jgi:hypothetical protein
MPKSCHQKRYRLNYQRIARTCQKCSSKGLIVIATRCADLIAKSPVNSI